MKLFTQAIFFLTVCFSDLNHMENVFGLDSFIIFDFIDSYPLIIQSVILVFAYFIHEIMPLRLIRFWLCSQNYL